MRCDLCGSTEHVNPICKTCLNCFREGLPLAVRLVTANQFDGEGRWIDGNGNVCGVGCGCTIGECDNPNPERRWRA
jgi:hypothetical protein